MENFEENLTERVLNTLGLIFYYGAFFVAALGLLVTMITSTAYPLIIGIIGGVACFIQYAFVMFYADTLKYLRTLINNQIEQTTIKPIEKNSVE